MRNFRVRADTAKCVSAMSTVCWYYIQGRCRFGDRCRNLHPPPDDYDEEYVEPRHSKSGRHSNFDFNAELEQFREKQHTRSYRNEGYQRRYTDTHYPPATNRRSDSNHYSYEPQHANRFHLPRDTGRSDSAVRAAAQKFDFNKALQDGARTSSRRGSSELSVDEVTVVSDMKSWEAGGQWLFTSYGPFGNSASYPGFYDISMEELRLQCYSAFQAGAVQGYVNQVKRASQTVLQSMHLLLSMPPDVKECLKNLRQGRTIVVPPASSVAGLVGPASVVRQAPAVGAAPPPQQKVQTATPAQPGAGTLSPSGNLAKQAYTPMESLKAAERKQFSAEHFTLGEIPIRPPPKQLCGLD